MCCCGGCCDEFNSGYGNEYSAKQLRCCCFKAVPLNEVQVLGRYAYIWLDIATVVTAGEVIVFELKRFVEFDGTWLNSGACCYPNVGSRCNSWYWWWWMNLRTIMAWTTYHSGWMWQITLIAVPLSISNTTIYPDARKIIAIIAVITHHHPIVIFTVALAATLQVFISTLHFVLFYNLNL